MDTKKLRQKILDLAIHGKLVPQDPNDEPASVLLERIREEKERLVKEGKIKKSKKSCANREQSQACLNSAEMQPRLAEGKSAASDTSHYENVPFELPEGWCWCRLDTLCDIKGGKRVPRGMSFSDAPTSHVYIRVTNMKKNTIIDNELKYIDDEVFSYIRNYIISKSDLYLTIAGTIGDVGEVPDKYDMMNLTENAAKLTNIICNRKYLMYSLLSSHAQEHFSSKFHQVAQPKLSIETASSTFVPIPPMEEQKRIVAKIEELLTIIDLFDNSKLDLELAILHAKSKILDLAIHGKLVPQDPNDEPASELLKRINPKAVASCDNPHYENVPFVIPSSWSWCKLESICSFLSRGKSPKYSETDKTYPVFAQKCNLKDGGISLEQARFLEPTTVNKWADVYKLRTGDVLVNSTGTGTVGRTRLFNESCLGNYPFVVPDSHVSVIRTINNICSEYIYILLSSNAVQQYMEENLAGSTNQKELYIGTIGNIDVPLPPYEEQVRISRKVKALYSQLDDIALMLG